MINKVEKTQTKKPDKLKENFPTIQEKIIILIIRYPNNLSFSFLNLIKFIDKARKSIPEKYIWGLLPLSKKIKIGQHSIVIGKKYLELKPSFFL